MTFTQDGLELLKKFEGCKLTAYEDQGGKLTIGYGHTEGVKFGDIVTREEAETFLKEDIKKFSDQVSKLVCSTLNDNQFSAAVCFAFNVRGWALTPLFDLLRRGYIEQAKLHWLLYCKVYVEGNKVESRGLKNRRQAELELFSRPLT